jgi:hypothetical protein
MARIEGESAQAKGADGARRAKRWLESTTRVNAQWVNPNAAAVPKLQFKWPHDPNNFTVLGDAFVYGHAARLLHGSDPTLSTTSMARSNVIRTH